MANRIARATIELVRASASARLDAGPEDVFSVLADLATWPRWLDVVTRVTPLDGDEPAWRVRLGVRFGPVDLGRDVRLVATTLAPPTALVVERRELDGRDDHSPIELGVAVAPTDDGRADVTLSALVGKRLPFLDLQGEIERRGPNALRRLERLVRPHPG
jgi:uncharacterized protein YndB with AHSA1/START domain